MTQRNEALADLFEFIEIIRNGDFYTDYDASVELLGKADRALAYLAAPVETHDESGGLR